MRMRENKSIRIVSRNFTALSYLQIMTHTDIISKWAISVVSR
jgi:hypothetical protein